MVLQNICVLPSIAYFVEKSPFLLENHELQRPSHIFLLILNLISNLSPIIYLLPPMFIFQSIFVMLHKLLCFLDIFLVGASAAQSSFNINQYTTEHQEDASEIKVKQLVKEFKEFKDGISPWLFVKFCFTVVNFFISLFSAKNYDFFLFFFPGLFLEMVYIILMLEKSFKVYQSLALKLRDNLENCCYENKRAVKNLIQEIETETAFSALGFFSIQRITLMSIVSISLTYSIILFQFSSVENL
ncbi:uncharacterized protein LOC111711838 [Eurytemora carolleeae]|uniref:uncharacterized protein LOC111711838 n=1 Tax=Eurytemora carolleeae TaxID=1294199 RepID=UPI000C778BFC|nr:uncharacterized protein LOC111711838 [Eurytemora carolleeae]|eukprot:XP_023342066.1 uncharacterized protein LOC111711838 [Eurytemora affinis]